MRLDEGAACILCLICQASEGFIRRNEEEPARFMLVKKGLILLYTLDKGTGMR